MYGLLVILLSASSPASPPAASPYPISDQTRSVARTVREQTGLTTQHLQSLGCDYEQTLEILRVVCARVEPQRGVLDDMRREYAAARFAYLDDAAAILALSDRLAVTNSAPLAAAQRGRLEEQLAVRTQRVDAARLRYELAEADLNEALAPLVELVAHELTSEQRRQWNAARANADTGLPHTTWFVPDLTEAQRDRLRAGAAAGDVLDPDQQAAAARSAEQYRGCAADVRRAESEFFFGPRREPAGASSRSTGPRPAGSACPFQK